MQFNIKLVKTALVGPFDGPVTGTATHDTGIDRVGTISDCRVNNSGLNCRQF